jgi:hypothetical protein
VSQAAHNYYVANCTVIKGVDGYRGYGALGATTYPAYGNICGAKLLPVCGFPAKPVSPGPQPVAPKKPAYPAVLPACVPPKPPAPKAPIRSPIVSTVVAPPKPPAPKAPVVTYAPSQAPAAAPAVVSELPVPVETPETTDETAPPPAKQASMVKGGLIALVVVAGGIILYKTFAKKKAA